MVALTRKASQLRLRGGRAIEGFRLGPLDGPLGRGARRARAPRARQLHARQLRARQLRARQLRARQLRARLPRRVAEAALLLVPWPEVAAQEHHEVNAGEPNPEVRQRGPKLPLVAQRDAVPPAEPAWDWEGYVRTMNDELGLPN
jgi:hypothetical protein